MGATKLNEFKDASGRIHVSVWEARATTPGDSQTDVECNIFSEDPSWACIGGGGRGSEDPGHMLTASYPMKDFKGWQISSKSHIISSPTAPTVWAIGMKIDRLSRNDLISNLKIEPKLDPASQHNDSIVDLPLSPDREQEYALLGGGFRIGDEEQPQPPDKGNFATGSFIDNSFGWRARSKDMSIPTSMPIKVFAIGIKRTITTLADPRTSVGFIDVAFNSNEVLPNTNHPESTAFVVPNYALCGGGAVTHFSYWNGGSYLWALEPVTEITEAPAKQSFTGRAKDHLIADPGTITAYAMGVRLFPS